ncbi:hypothetical protein JL722_7198 [Aureococcus anophagefferens]|nr:hypothetical protein JL722_7198 [Aureococcus anophagefferens]
MSSTDTLYGASDARRTEEPAVAADGAEDAADGAEAAASDASAALPDDAAGVDMFGNPVSESGELEWKIGVLWRDKEKIDVTWVRCKEDGNSEWGWGASGKWRLEDGSFLTFTRLPWWSGALLRRGADGNFVEGVRGWKPFESATIMGQWQAIRLGVEGRGAAPWFEDEEGE